MTISIYLIDDDLKFSKLLMDELDSEPAFEVIGNALTLDSARRFIKTQEIDVFLVDIALPDGSGIDLMRELSRSRPASRVLALSTLGDKKHILGSIEAGATGFLLKSEPPENFIRSIIAMVTHGGYLGAHASHILIGHIQQTFSKNQDKNLAKNPVKNTSADNTESKSQSITVPLETPNRIMQETGVQQAPQAQQAIRIQAAQTDFPDNSKISDKIVESIPGPSENIVKDEFTPREIQVIQILQLGQPAKLMASKLGVSTFTINQHLRSIYRKLNARNKMEAVLNARGMGLL
ncbi:MAG: response regulator transcription factor [Rhodoferax sp.]|nr:response regulator transcription factor [Rhodoferax sp.]